VTPARLDRLDLAYARFNALKTVSTVRDSRFTEHAVGPLTVTTDGARDGAYYNRVIGLTPGSIAFLDKALRLLSDRPRVRVDVETGDVSRLAPVLRSIGFRLTAELAWLGADPEEAAPDTAPTSVRRLTPDDLDAVRSLLELEGRIDDDIWDARRAHLGTETFRLFGLHAGKDLVAMATCWRSGEHAILGNAFTLPAHRGRGHQRALLAARLVDARDLGLDFVATDVEPGTASHRNCRAVGLPEIRAQSVWERSP
jgi:GNAT superfamily N-acetyltransferase